MRIKKGMFLQFQFTHPGRGATPKDYFTGVVPSVSIHAPREGCDQAGLVARQTLTVSIHAPREGCDARVLSNEIPAYEFQFTHPGRGATVYRVEFDEEQTVSIHAPREGCDYTHLTDSLVKKKFQFTHPGRGATPSTRRKKDEQDVSIHAPREGCDVLYSA